MHNLKKNRIKAWGFLVLDSITCVCCVCQSNNQEPVFLWDGSFVVGGISFPNDSVYNRSIVNVGATWRMSCFISKCKEQRSVRIGFIGGSITAGDMASSRRKGFSSLFCSSLKHLFPNLESINEINAGLGGTGSRFGCSRLQSDLLVYMPDLIIIEFAVNDFGTGDSTYIRSCMEGLVRQCLFYNNNIPMILLFMSKGDGKNVQNLHADVGNYYSLPMISYRDAIWPLVEQNRAMYDTLFYDDPHPNDNGHCLCAYLLYSFVKNSLQTPQAPAEAIPAFCYSDLYQYAGICTVGDTNLHFIQNGWDTLVKEKSRLGLKTSVDSAVLELQAACDEITLQIHLQPTSNSSIHVDIDNGISDTTILDYYFTESKNWFRIYTSNVQSTHPIEIVHHGSNLFTIDYILYAKK